MYFIGLTPLAFLWLWVAFGLVAVWLDASGGAAVFLMFPLAQTRGMPQFRQATQPILSSTEFSPFRAGVKRTRADQAVVAVLLDNVGAPARDARTGEDRGI
jgi:hypothetical protein